jgi:hypothetical protein
MIESYVEIFERKLKVPISGKDGKQKAREVPPELRDSAYVQPQRQFSI